MDPVRLGNLLSEIERRLSRASKLLKESPQGSGDKEILRHVDLILAETRRQLSKIDALKATDVDRIEKLFEELHHRVVEIRPNLIRAGAPLINLQVFKQILTGLRIGLSVLGPEDILDTVPGQKTAAFKFGFKEDVLFVIDQPISSSSREAEVAWSALHEAMSQGEYVCEDLRNSNVSSRLKDSFVSLQNSLEAKSNIVQIGSRATMCSRLVTAEHDEISRTLSGLLVGHLETVSRALLQFQEWREYCENAMSLHIDPPALATVVDGVNALSSDVKLYPTVDRTVVDALDLVSGWVAEQPEPDKRDVLSLMRVLENVWSIVTRSLLSVRNEVTTEARKLAAKAILGALLYGFAVNAIPALSALPGGGWIQNAYHHFILTEPNKVP